MCNFVSASFFLLSLTLSLSCRYYMSLSLYLSFSFVSISFDVDPVLSCTDERTFAFALKPKKECNSKKCRFCFALFCFVLFCYVGSIFSFSFSFCLNPLPKKGYFGRDCAIWCRNIGHCTTMQKHRLKDLTLFEKITLLKFMSLQHKHLIKW